MNKYKGIKTKTNVSIAETYVDRVVDFVANGLELKVKWKEYWNKKD